MDIRIKTAEEFHDSHVTIEIAAADQAEAGEVAERLYNPDKAVEVILGNFQRARQQIEKLKTQLDRERKAHVCTDRCTKNAHVAMQGRQRVTELEANLADADRKNQDLASQLTFERERAEKARILAAQNREWAERAEAKVSKLEKTVAELDLVKSAQGKHLCAVTHRLGAVSKAVNYGDVTSALDSNSQMSISDRLAVFGDAIMATRGTLFSEPPEPTSQA